MTPSTGAEIAVEAALTILAATPDQRVTLSELAQATGLSPAYLQRRFVALTGMSPHEAGVALRVTRFRASAQRDPQLVSALYEAGFGSSRGLYEVARSHLGMTPGRYARGAPGERISYVVRDSALGRVLVAATRHGICAVFLGDDEAPLVEALRAEFPGAEFPEAEFPEAEFPEAEFPEADAMPPAPIPSAWLGGVLDHIAGVHLALAVPLDYRGTPFQLRVWRALRSVPAGETRTYSQLAADCGKPRAARAVASACAHNPVAVLVPCHRIVRANGQTGGYRWGPQRKRALLEREARTRPHTESTPPPTPS